MAEFTVTAKELYNKAAELERQNSQLQTKINQLETEENALSGMWEGDSHDAFDTNFKSNKGKMTTFHAEIAKYVAALRTIAAKYEVAESRNVVTAQSK